MKLREHFLYAKKITILFNNIELFWSICACCSVPHGGAADTEEADVPLLRVWNDGGKGLCTLSPKCSKIILIRFDFMHFRLGGQQRKYMRK